MILFVDTAGLLDAVRPAGAIIETVEEPAEPEPHFLTAWEIVLAVEWACFINNQGWKIEDASA